MAISIPDKLKSRKFQLTLGGLLALVGKCLTQGNIQTEDIVAGVTLITQYNVANAIQKV